MLSKLDCSPDKLHLEDDAAAMVTGLPVLENQEEPGARKTGICASVKRYRWAVCCSLLASCGALSEGFQTSLPTELIVTPGFVHQLGISGLGPRGSRALDPVHITAWSAAHTAAYICGLLFAFLPVDYFGRKNSLYTSQALLAIGCTIEVLAKDWITWLVAKVVMGLAVGLGQCAAVAYISEISPTRLRGSLLATYPLMYTLGRFSATIAIQVLVLTSSFRYRRVLYAQYFFVTIAVAGLGVIPESPRWLASKGRHEEATISIHRLNGASTYDAGTDYRDLMGEIDSDATLSTGSPVRKISLLSGGPNLRRGLISEFCLVWTQWLGSKIIFGYNTYFFQLSGILDPFTPNVVLSSITILGAGCSMYLIERVGRRRLLLVNAPMMVAIVLLVGGLNSLPPASVNGSALVFLACLFAGVHSASVGSVAFAYLGETSSVTLRAVSISMAAGGAGIINLAVDYCSPIMLNSHNFGLSCTAWVFAGMGSAGLVACYLYVPETANKSFAHLDELFSARIPARRFGVQAEDQPRATSDDPKTV